MTENDIADVTLKHVLVDADYNDLGFSVGSRLMVLVESQCLFHFRGAGLLSLHR